MSKPSMEQKLQIAQLSFVQKMKNKEIAAILRPGKTITNKTNIQWVKEWIEETGTWLLNEQKRLHQIENAGTAERSLAQDLVQKFGLMDARVVPGGEPTPAGYAPLDEHAKAAAIYFDGVVSLNEHKEEDLHVAVTGGQTVLQMVSALAPIERKRVHFYSAALIGRGRRAHGVAHVSPESNATIAWSRSGAIHGNLYCGTVSPYDIVSAHTDKKKKNDDVRKQIGEQIKLFLSSGAIRQVLKDMNDNINMAIAGIGLLRPTELDANVDDANHISMNWGLKLLGVDLDLLAKEGVIGDICYAMFDELGRGRDEWQFFITAGERSKFRGVDFYRNLVEMGRPVIVIAGARKESAILAAMKPDKKLFNVLVTDAYTAQRLLASK